VRAASCKQQGFGESALNSAIENEGDSPLPPGERALLEFVERFNEGPGSVTATAYEELRAYWTEDQIVEFLIFFLFNIGYHTLFATFDFYPMFAPDGSLVTQEEARAIYGSAPAPLESARSED
jgi:hypothetical protein